VADAIFRSAKSLNIAIGADPDRGKINSANFTAMPMIMNANDVKD
jgi:hypothetical protein